MLLLPGLMNDARVWGPILQVISLDRVVVKGQTHIADNIGALAAAALARMPAGRFAVAGFSLGGYVALEVCRQARDRVAGVALIDTSARADTAEARLDRQRMIDRLKAGSATFDQVAAEFPARLLHPAHANDAQLLKLLGDMAHAVGVDGFVRQQTAAMHRVDRRDVLQALECPALVVCGREDKVTPPERSEQMAHLIKGDVELVLVPQAGHLAMLEQPAAVIEPFLRWLSKVDAAPPTPSPAGASH
ncbi:MAG: alpha/beta hydrolase [Burkholderiales bacterium]|nr:alpha/beta hydrolase [Burkholderiales bacterium]